MGSRGREDWLSKVFTNFLGGVDVDLVVDVDSVE